MTKVKIDSFDAFTGITVQRNSVKEKGLESARTDHPGLAIENLVLRVGAPSGKICPSCQEPEFELMDKVTLAKVSCCRGLINAARMASHLENSGSPNLTLQATAKYDDLGMLVGMSRVIHPVEDGERMEDGVPKVVPGIKSLVATGRVSFDEATGVITIDDMAAGP